MGSFGDKLRRERELRAVTLDEIAEATKIGTRSLKALEDEQFEILPGGIFNKGFVRAYAKYLGIDEEQAVADYADAVSKASGTGSATPSDEAVVASIAKKRSEPEKKIGVDNGGSSKVWVSLAVIALIGAGGYSSWKYYQQRNAEKAAQQTAIAETQTAPVQPAPVPVQTQSTPAEQTAANATSTNSVETASTPTTNPSPTTASIENVPAKRPTDPALVAGEFTLTLHAIDDVWIQVDADGTTRQELMSAASDRTIRAKEKVVMKVGKPAALEVSFNGTPVGPLGPPDKVVTRTFTAEGMQQ